MKKVSLELQQLTYGWPNQANIIDIPALTLLLGESLFVQGSSGSGKSTLLNLLSGVLTPRSGTVRLLEREFSSLKLRKRDQFRADHIGYIFQQFNLLPFLSVIENVLMPCHMSDLRRDVKTVNLAQLNEIAIDWLTRLNVPPALHHEKVIRLSIGQQQRVAAARALIGSPEIIIADEPTSALDQDNVDTFMAVLTEQCQSIGSSLIFVSHDRHLEKYFNHSLHLGLTPDKERI